MGRIDEALRRANLDVGRGTGAAVPTTPTPEGAPWRFEQGGAREDAEPAAVPAPHAVGEVPMAVAPVEVPRAAPAGDRFDGRNNPRVVVSQNAPPLLVEQFRSLTAGLLANQGDQPLKSLMVTSAAPGDGKSHVAVNLALTLSESYRRTVLLIDADMRRPSLHHVFGVRNTSGLSDALRAKTDEKAATIRMTETLSLLTAGRPDPNHLGDLSSDVMKDVVADACSCYEWVIVDSPPVGVLADARLVAETVDAVILVVRAGVTQFPDVKAAAETIGADRIVGVVLNAVEPGEIRGEGYYRHYYEPRGDK